MDGSTVIIVIVGLVLTGITAYLVAMRQHGTVDYSDALDEFRQVIQLVERFAPAADRLVKLKELTPVERRAAVIEMVISVLPNVSPELVKWIIENWAEVTQPELKKTLADFKSDSGK